MTDPTAERPEITAARETVIRDIQMIANECHATFMNLATNPAAQENSRCDTWDAALICIRERDPASSLMVEHLDRLIEAAKAAGRSTQRDELLALPGPSGKEHWFCGCPIHVALAEAHDGG